MILKDLPQSLRPREKLLTHGPTALGDAELLALLLRTGMPGKNALQLGQELLDTFGGLIGLLHAPSAALGRIKGLGPAKRTVVMAVLELARRALSQQITQLPLFESPASVRDFLQLQLGGKSYEVFAVLFLDSQHRMIAFEEVFRGTLNQTSVYPREIVVRALAHHAGGVVLAHNHPSGSALPSRSDEALTRTLKAALALIDVEVHDHFVVTATNAVSMAELGML